MAAIAAGSKVLTIASWVAAEALLQRPKLGVVQSLTASSPPTNVAVDWEDGSQTTYGDSFLTLFQATVPTSPSLLGKYVSLSPTIVPNFNIDGRYGGFVVMHLDVSLTDGTNPAETVLIQTPTGFVMLPVADIVVDPNR